MARWIEVSEHTRLLTGQVAIVTGGSNGLGAAIVDRFAENGALGAIIDWKTGPTHRPPDSWQVIQADVRDANSLNSAFEEVIRIFKVVDVVVANAGIVPSWTSTTEIDLDAWENVFAVNSVTVTTVPIGSGDRMTLAFGVVTRPTQPA